jgi:hypothetical protein
MGNIFKDLAIKYHTGSLLIKLIFINIAVFLIVRLTGVVLTLSGTDINPLLSYLQLPSNLSILAWRPWTLVSYIRLAAHPIQYALAILVRTAISALLQ